MLKLEENVLTTFYMNMNLAALMTTQLLKGPDKLNCIDFIQANSPLRIVTGKKYRQMKLQRLQKVQIWTFGSSVRQINSS